MLYKCSFGLLSGFWLGCIVWSVFPSLFSLFSSLFSSLFRSPVLIFLFLSLSFSSRPAVLRWSCIRYDWLKVDFIFWFVRTREIELKKVVLNHTRVFSDFCPAISRTILCDPHPSLFTLLSSLFSYTLVVLDICIHKPCFFHRLGFRVFTESHFTLSFPNIPFSALAGFSRFSNAFSTSCG